MAIDVAKYIDERPVSGFQWSVFIAAMAVATLDGYDLQSMGLTRATIMKEWGITSIDDFSIVLTATPVGMIFGALGLGVLADRWGRKIPVMIATSLFGVFSLLTAFAPNVETMALCRFLMGLGTGGILPNLIALVSEYAPERKRATLTTLSFAAIPFGSFISSFIANWLMPEFGWKSVYYVGGILPLLIVVWCAWRLPESIRFLAAKGNNGPRIAAILTKVSGTPVSPSEGFTVPDQSKAKVSLSRLFGPGRTGPTVLMTFVLACNTLMLYFLLSWLPKVMALTGLSDHAANLATSLPNLGGVFGAITLGLFIDRLNGFRVMAFGGLVAGTALLAVGYGYSNPVVLIPALFLVGTCIMGGQPAIYALLASLYPTTIRSTGAGFTLGIGRFGSVLGPYVGAMVIALEWNAQEIFTAVAVPAFAVAVSLWAISLMRRDFT